MMPLKHWQTIAVVGLFLAVFALSRYWIVYVPGYLDLLVSSPIYIAQSYRTVIGIILVFLLAHAMLRKTGTGVLDALGLSQAPWPAAVAAVMMVLPLYLTFALAFGLTQLVPMELLFLVVISPFAEELAFRGFAFNFLRRIAGWGFWPAALAPAVIFGIGHIIQANDTTVLMKTLLLTAGGSILFAWLFEKWGGLWVPFAFHALLNLAWELFAAGEGTYAGTLPIVMQVVTVAMAVLVTLFRDRLPLLKAVRPARAGEVNLNPVSGGSG